MASNVIATSAIYAYFAAMVGLYCKKTETRWRLRQALADADCSATDRRKTFQDLLLGGVSVAVVALEQFSHDDIRWLRTLSARGGPAGPSFLVVVPVSLEWVRWMRSPGDNEFQIVWAEEAHERLMRVVARIDPWHQDPMRLLGRRLLANQVLHSSLVKVVQRVCRTEADDGSLLPVTSVGELAEHTSMNPRALRRYWNTESPVQCTLKELLSWAILLWALRERRLAKWDSVAQRLGLRRRTLERYSARFLDCTLVVAGQDPRRVIRSFREWASAAVMLPAAENTEPGEPIFVPAGSNGQVASESGPAVPMVSWPAPPGFVLPRQEKQEFIVFSQQRPRQLHPWRSLPMA